MQLKYGIKNSPVLTDLQKKVLLEFGKEPFISENFYLTGGTALSAFYFNHRYSEDLDFFTHDVSLKDMDNILSMVFKKMGLSYKALQSAPYIHRYLVETDLKLDFVVDSPQRIGSPILSDQLLIDNMSNIATNKVCTILGRLDAKDYVDLYYILENTDLKLDKLMEWAKLKDGGMDLFIWASLLGEVNHFQVLPRMIQPLSLKKLQSYYLALRDQLLATLKPK